jgi:hypothetical protein
VTLELSDTFVIRVVMILTWELRRACRLSPRRDGSRIVRHFFKGVVRDKCLPNLLVRELREVRVRQLQNALDLQQVRG